MKKRFVWGSSYQIKGILRLRSAERRSIEHTLQSYGFEKRIDDEISFTEIVRRKNLVTHLLRTNTFFQAKVGFYEKILYLLKSQGEHSLLLRTVEQVSTLSDLKEAYERLIVIPCSATTKDLNVIIAHALNIAASKVPVWVVAPFTEVSRSLLVNFENFFVVLQSQEEMDFLLSVIDISHIDTGKWVENIFRNEERGLRTITLFVTNYKDMSQEGRIAIYTVKHE